MSDDPLFFSDDNKNNNNSNNDIDIEEDLMAAMNAALDDESEGGLGLVYGSEADTESLLSIDVMGEAMNLLSSSDTASATGSGSVEEEEEEATMTTTTTTTTAGDLDGKEISIDTACDTGGAGDAPQDGEEQIDFDDFMAGKATIDDGEDDDDDGEGNKRGEVDPKAPDESADAENDSGPTTANGTAASSHSPATTASITDDDDDDDEKEPPREQPERQPETTASVSVSVSVPLQQFENALALIQDLEHRVLVLETDRQRLVEDNTVLREETLRQATEISTLQAKLAEFPKLLEETVDEEAKLAAAKAEAETKFSFWKKDMDRQEKESEEEKRKRNRKNAATTDSLKQEDFLKGIVELKEQEEQSAASSSGGLGVVVGVGELLSKVGGSGSASAQQPHSQPPADGPHSELADANDNDNNNDDNNNNNQQPRRGRFSFLRGWGGRNNNKDKEKDENNNKEHKDNDQNNEENEDGEDTSDETDGVGVGVGAPESSGPADISAIATTKSSGGGDEGELLRISRSHDSSGSAGDGPLDTGGEDYGSNDLTNVVVYDPQNPDEKMLGLLM